MEVVMVEVVWNNLSVLSHFASANISCDFETCFGYLVILINDILTNDILTNDEIVILKKC